MTSKRLSILLFTLAFVWSVAGLGWFTVFCGDRAESAFGVDAAQAGSSSWNQLLTTNTVDGDPDSFANTPNGDPDAFTRPPSPSDTTGTLVASPGDGSGHTPPLLQVILEVGSAISGILGWN